MAAQRLPLAFTGLKGHNHQHCQQQVLNTAARLCQQRHVRLTPLRRQVLALICHSHQPLGAYALLEQLQTEQGRRAAPPTVYRALDFLLEQGLIHRIASLNAFVGCFQPEQPHIGHFLICERCGNAAEFDTPELNQQLQQTTDQLGFKVTQQTVELFGRCAQCQQQDAS